MAMEEDMESAFAYLQPIKWQKLGIQCHKFSPIFSQKQPDGEWHPVAYYLKTIIDAELNYHIHNKEMLAIISSF